MRISIEIKDKSLKVVSGTQGFCNFFKACILNNYSQVAELEAEYSVEEEKSLQAVFNTVDITATLLKKSLKLFKEVK